MLVPKDRMIHIQAKCNREQWLARRNYEAFAQGTGAVLTITPDFTFKKYFYPFPHSAVSLNVLKSKRQDFQYWEHMNNLREREESRILRWFKSEFGEGETFRNFEKLDFPSKYSDLVQERKGVEKSFLDNRFKSVHKRGQEIAWNLEHKIFKVVQEGSNIRVQINIEYLKKNVAGSGSKCVTDFSEKSRKRFLEKMMSVDWDKYDKKQVFFVTLTYPPELHVNWSTPYVYYRRYEIGPDNSFHGMNASDLKNDIDLYAKMLGRKTEGKRGLKNPFEKPSFFYKVEFTRNRNPHLHLIVFHQGNCSEGKARTYLKFMWWKRVGKISTEHYKKGCRVEAIKKSVHSALIYMTKYLTGKNEENEKKYQEIIPDHFIGMGSFWGNPLKKNIILGIYRSREITQGEALEIMAKMDRYTSKKFNKNYKYKLESFGLSISDKRVIDDIFSTDTVPF